MFKPCESRHLLIWFTILEVMHLKYLLWPDKYFSFIENIRSADWTTPAPTPTMWSYNMLPVYRAPSKNIYGTQPVTQPILFATLDILCTLLGQFTTLLAYCL